MTKIAKPDAVILCGGKGTRLQSLVSDKPKPMAEIQGKPFLALLVDYLLEQGISRFVFCTGHLHDPIHQYFSSGDYAKLDAVFSRELSPLGTGGAAAHALPHIQSEHFLLLNGDSFCPFSLTQFLETHQQHQALISMAILHKDDASRYGQLSLNKDQRILAFEEKAAQATPGFINGGIYLLSKQVFERPDIQNLGDVFSLEKEVFPKLLAQKTHLQGVPCEAKAFIDIGTPESYLSVKESGLDNR